MKFSLSLLALTSISIVTAAPMNGCWRQSNCIIFTTEKIDSGSTCTGADDCEFKICAELDLLNPDCVKSASDTVSHTCIKDDTTCNDGGGFSNAVNTGSIPDNHKQCQTVPAGGVAEFIFKDGGGCAGEKPSRLGNTLAMCAPTTEESCSGKGNVGKECVWTAEAPPCFPFTKVPPPDTGSCPLYTLDFNADYISPGQYITDELKADYKVTISATGGYSPDGAARIFDTSNPGTKADGDPDLGSPNKGCPGFDPPGPGEGDGGKPGTYHHNCIPQGNVLIIQEENKKTPDDNGGGGTLTFDFDEAVKLDNLKILDVDDNGKTPKVFVTLSDGNVIQFDATEVGDNGVDTIDIDLVDVTSVKVEFPGSGAVAELNYRICPDVTDDAPAPTASPTASPTSSRTATASPTHDDTCPFYNLDFNESYITAGDYITNQFEADYFVTVLASGGYTPGGAARIFDSSNPGSQEDGDPDLGSPNEKCNVDGPKPGVGDGGAPGSVGENCVPLGNLLIVQEGNKDTPDDNAGGGVITFTFKKPAKVEDVKLLDVDKSGEEPKVKIITMDGSEYVESAPKVGNNGVSVIYVNKVDVTSVTVIFDGSGSVAELNYHICPSTSSPTAAPIAATPDATPSPTSAPTPSPTAKRTASPTHDDTCPFYNLDFDESYVSAGDYITNQFEADYFVTVLASGGYTPGGAARIFDSSNPGTKENGDPDLGSPNEKCNVDGPKPGVGDGGVPGSVGENCVPLGNLLIVQEENKDTPDDNAGGGVITFTFKKPAKVEDVKLLDVDKWGEEPKVKIITMDGSEYIESAPKVGDNGVSVIYVNKVDVTSVTVTFDGSGSVAELNYHICPSTSSPTAAPIAATPGATPSPTSAPTLSQTSGPTASPVATPDDPVVAQAAPTASPSASPTAKDFPNGDVKNGEKDPFYPGQYHDGSCMEDFWMHSGEDASLICRTKDVELDSIVAIGASTCKVGETILVSLSGNVLVTNGGTKYDLGWYVASDGGEALTGTCAVNTLAEDADPAIVGPVSWNSDASGANDVCGDVSGDLIDLELGTNIHIVCTDENEDGYADVSICLGWKEMDADGTCDPSGVVPGSVTSCNCATFDLKEIMIEKRISHSTCI